MKQLYFTLFNLQAILLLILLFAGSVHAQKKRYLQHWEAGITGGTSYITGDIPPVPGYGGSINLSRSFSRVLSARLDYTYSRNYGLDYRRRKVSRMAWENDYDPWVYYYGNTDQPFAANYRTSLHQFSLQALAGFHLGKKKGATPAARLYGYAGYTYTMADIDVDALDANGQPYDFTSPSYPIDFRASRSQVLKALRQHMDLDYESSWGFRQSQVTNHFRGRVPHPVRHAVSIGGGAQVNLSPKTALQLDYRLSSPFTDYLDGVTTGSKSDIHHFASMGFVYRFGGSKSLKKNDAIPGVSLTTTSTGRLRTVIHVVDPSVVAKRKIEDGDTSYHLNFNFMPIVPGRVTPLHSAHLRLNNKQWIELPVDDETRVMTPGKRFYYAVKISHRQLQMLATHKVTHLSLSTSTLQLDDEVSKHKQKLLRRMARKMVD